MHNISQKHLLTLYNITITIIIFSCTEARVTLQYSLQEHVAVDLKTQDSQLVSSQSSVAAICGLGLKVTSHVTSSEFYLLCWHNSLVIEVAIFYTWFGFKGHLM